MGFAKSRRGQAGHEQQWRIQEVLQASQHDMRPRFVKIPLVAMGILIGWTLRVWSSVRSASRSIGQKAAAAVNWFVGGLKDPKTRFLFAYCVIFVLSQTWTVCLFWVNRDRPDLAAEWFANQLTYSMVHWTTFAFAVGLLATVCDSQVTGEFSIYRSGKYVGWLALIVFVLMAAAVSDGGWGTPDPYMLNTAHGRVVAMEKAEVLRKTHMDQDRESAQNGGFLNNQPGKADFDKDVKAYKQSVKDFKATYLDGAKSLTGKLARCNAVPIFSFGLTVFFSVFLAMAIWYIYAVLPQMFRALSDVKDDLKRRKSALKGRRKGVGVGGTEGMDPTEESGSPKHEIRGHNRKKVRHDNVKDTGLIREGNALRREIREYNEKKKRYEKFLDEVFKINLLFATWLPCRYYATWYCNYYLDGGTFFFPLFILAVAEFGALLFLMTLRKGYDITVVVATIVTLCGGVLAILGLVSNKTTELMLKALYDYLNVGIIAHLCLCAFALVFAFAFSQIRAGQDVRKRRSEERLAES
jgi:hypothetical protein